MKLFVYGSLKRGYWNNERCLRGQTFVKEAETLPAYRLFSNGSYPQLVKANNGDGLAIKGEIWEINDKNCLDGMDAMEKGAGYIREKVKMANDEGVEGYIYIREINTNYHKDCGNEWTGK